MNRRGRIAATVGLLVLVLVDIALVFAALRITSRSGAAEPAVTGAAVPSSTETPTAPPESTTSTATPSTTSTGTSTSGPASAPAVPLQVMLSAVDGSIAWRAKAGSCGSGGASVALTADGGKTWRSRTSPYPVLSRVQASDGSRAFAVGAPASCDMGVKTTSDGGATWPGGGSLADTLARDLKDPSKVRAPGGRTVSPCDGAPVADLARSSATGAQALCADGGIRSTTDDGRTWPKVADQPGAMALDSRPLGGTVTTYLAVLKPGCAGVAVASVAGSAVTDLACVPMEVPAPGMIAIAVPTADAGWLLVGDTTWRSSGGLSTWARSAG